MYAPFIIQWEGKLYPYTNPTLLGIAIVENAKEGLVPEGLWKLVGVGFGYEYHQIEIDELLTPAPVPVQQLEGMVA